MGERWFIGLDLAWSDRHESGLALLRCRHGALEFVDTDVARDLGEMAARIRALSGAWWIGIDAPLVVANRTGRRPVDGLLSAIYGRFHAGAHPTNQRLLQGKVRGGDLVRLLANDGVEMASGADGAGPDAGRWAFETYPHAAMVELFSLRRIFKYKHGRVAARRLQMQELAACLRRRLPTLDPPLLISSGLATLLGVSTQSLRGRLLKRHEDMLDALVCAYVAAHLSWWGERRNWLLGDAASGAVILPALRADLVLRR